MTSGHSPYDDLPPRAFWRTGVMGQPAGAMAGLYRKKFDIGRDTRIATAGSCFAQHIGRHLRARGFNVVDAEPAPPGLSATEAAQFGFGLFSARHGNIYTTRQLLQLFREAAGEFTPEDIVWERDGHYFDALRPGVETAGLSKPETVLAHRTYHLERVRTVLADADVFVFTLGLTEAWVHGASGTVYPTAPGVIAGRYDPAVHAFRNFTFQDVHADLTAFMEFARRAKSGIKVLFTVSPVPLTATAGDEHVLAATIYSKSVLRAVAGQLAHEHADVDYFPAYEIVVGTPSKGAFFEDNMRSVRAAGVDAVMAAFFAEHDPAGAVAAPAETAATDDDMPEDEAVCEEILLEAFSR